MVAYDISYLSYYGPILAYLLVALVSSAIFIKMKTLGEATWWNVFAGLAVATLFVSSARAIDFVTVLTPWIAVLLLSAFFVLVFTGFLGMKLGEGAVKHVPKIMIFVFGAVFLFSAYAVYGDVVGPYLPGESYYGNDLTDFLYSPDVVGGVMLLIVAGLVASVLTRK